MDQNSVQPDQQEGQNAKPQVVEALGSRDAMLMMLVSAVNEQNISTNVTLFVGGIVITGQLVSLKRYFDAFADQFGTAFHETEESRNELRNFLHGEFMAGPWTHEGPFMLHIQNPTIRYSPTDTVVLNNGWWRGKISSVDAFLLGSSAS